MVRQLLSVLSVIFFFYSPLSLFAQTDFSSANHKKAVELARKGELKKSITLFKQLLSAKPDDQKLLSDYLLVLSWAEECNEVTKIYEQTLKTPSLDILNATAKCYRNLKKFSLAILTYEAAVLKAPENRETQLGLAYAYADAGREKESLEMLEKLLVSDQADEKPHFAKAYLYTNRKQYLKALREYDAILENNPDHDQAWRLKIKMLSKLGAHQIALETLSERNHPDNQAMETHIKLNRAAEALRWGKHIDVLSQQERVKEVDLALEILSEVLKKEPRNIRARSDQAIALFERFEITNGIAVYEQLKGEGLPLANSLEMAAAEAYLTLRRPGEAITIYRTILKQRPHDFKTRLNLFYATLALNHFGEAEEMLRELRAEESSPTVNRQGLLEPNWRKVELESAAIWLTAYRDQLADAEGQFRTLLDQAPMNGSLHSGLAHITLWRGWPRKALGEFEQILHHDPRYVGVRVGYATTLMQMNQYEKAGIEIAKLVRQAPLDPHVKTLQEAWRVHHQNELWAYSDYRREERGSRAWYAEFSLNSRPYFSSFRITADVIQQESSADDNESSYSRFLPGFSYDSKQGLSIKQKISFDLESSGKTGSVTHIAYRFNDYWRLDAGYDSFSLDVPLRASVIGITAKSLDIGLQYRANERKTFHYSISQIRLSDGNRRDRYRLQTRYKLVPKATYSHFVQVNVSSSRNSLADRPYFNPNNDFAYSITTTHEWRRRNSRPGKGFRQTLSGRVGGYHQSGFSPGFTGELKYSHDWDFSVGKSLAYHIVYNRQIYDGEAEHSPAFNIRLMHHF